MLRASEETREKENDLTNYQKLSEIIRNYKGDIGELLDVLHMAHQGVTGMYHAAQHSVMWPGLHDDLEGVRRACDTCNVNARSNSNLPARPIED